MPTNDSEYSLLWNEKIWFPEKHDFGWKDLKNEPGSSTYYPQIEDLNWTILIGVGLIFVRYFLETFLVVPIAISLGVPDKKRQNVSPNKQLEAAYMQHKTLQHTLIKSLSKQTDLTERQIEVWFRKRKKIDQPLPLQKFRECSWHLMFYSTFFIYGMIVLWDKPYFWKSIHCWEGWPRQVAMATEVVVNDCMETLFQVFLIAPNFILFYGIGYTFKDLDLQQAKILDSSKLRAVADNKLKHVSNDIYWYYMMELGFYWSLVFTLCTDHKRKDFKEMIIHHFATIVLMYFSWVLNFVRVGTLVLVVHDSADSWLAKESSIDPEDDEDKFQVSPTRRKIAFENLEKGEMLLAKMSIYIKNKTATDIFFGIFLVTWVISRLFIYPYVVLYCTTVEPYTIGLMDKTFWAHQFFNFFLYLLQILHLIWTYLIFRIVYRKLKKGNVEDVRSDSEDSGADSDDESEELNYDKTLENGHTVPENDQNSISKIPEAKMNGNQNLVQQNGASIKVNES